MKPHILFIINGLGLGNSTRCHSIIQHLLSHGATVDIVTSGNGLWYFENRTGFEKLYPIESLYYASKESQISILSTLTSIREFVGILRRNAKLVSDIIRERKPCAIVIDSDYSIIFQNKKKLGLPIIALNNSDVVYHSYHKFRDKPKTIRAQFYAIEQMDYLFHKVVPDAVFSPSLDHSVPTVAGIHRVGPMVRVGYSPIPHKSSPKRVVIMLSGSGFGSRVVLQQEKYPVHFDVLGRERPDEVPVRSDVTYHGKVIDSYPYLKEADLVVVNGGFSAVSEAFCMKMPMLVVPVPRHAEQWVNARTIEDLGVGAMAQEEMIEGAILSALERIDEFRSAYEKLPPIRDGAKEASDFILKMAKQSQASS